MNTPPPLFIKRRCERCEQLYAIPNIRESRVRETLLVCFPCTWCFYSQCDPTNIMGRCVGCSIPFNIIDHHAKGRCTRCYMSFLRDATKQGPGDTLLHNG